MIINKICITNLGVFSGKHEFNLRPIISSDQFKPIVIFGGMNGSGKTTIFDAIKLCLYGPNISPQISSANYTEYLKEKIHYSSGLFLQPNFASIEIEFEYSKFGELDTYKVERMWERMGRKVSETLIIRKNGKDIDDVERDNWQEFIEELIPIGLSQLFFFDGEKIQKMMSDDNNFELQRSIKALIGLDVVERLQADLKIYRTKSLKQTFSEDLKKDLEEYERESALIDEEIQKIKSQKAELENGLSRLITKIKDYKGKIAAQGGGFLRRRDQLEEKRKILEQETEILKDRIRELAAGLLPISIAHDYALRLREQILKENEKRAWVLESKILNRKRDELLEHINSDSFLDTLSGINKEVTDKVRESLRTTIQKLFSGPSGSFNITEIYGFSEKQSFQVVQNIEEAITVVPRKLNEFIGEYEKKYREIQETYTNLQRVPEEDLIQPMYERLNELNIELGKLTNEREHYDAELKSLTNRKNEIQRKIDGIMRKMEDNRKSHEKVELAKKTERVLSEYYKKLTKLKVSHLEREFLSVFNKLHSKEDMISKIEINPESFDVYLYDKSGTRINKNNLSSGELEIYAMSMVWALAKISGQKLPFIVDTPLARLDSEHRDNLINLFFPHASHQMIIFSTNTEVDKRHFDNLKPFISRSYFLEYSDQQKKTIIKQGYFWN